MPGEFSSIAPCRGRCECSIPEPCITSWTGDRQERIFLDDVDRHDWLKTLAEACQKTGWQTHAYCLMSNHFHLVLETPNANLVEGMRLYLACTRH